ncbi:MAG: CerR family C-terminal domain-containing protein [Proteobacteria bacterium]|nr:CerR family C-terminal domain-containing protein [Pseudomonadota bacterium]MBU1547825.1 CerR family C-terminal domain-containing protein [Pseudomonadota bacterium]MBU2618754.1 CerR family C-terminal domain-containing protein [Pseudomonadota bacterium]
MRKQRSDGQETRRNLLAAAGEIFAAKGFRETTIAEICTQAEANTAAVSYHFGSKEALYVESWRYAFTRSLSIYPPDGGIPAEAPAEERLHGRIRAIMRRITDPQSHDFDIFHKEMANPTGLLATATQESMEQIFKGLTLLVCELLDKKTDSQEVQLCAMSIRAQCFGPLLHARCRKSVQGLPTTGFESLLENVEQLADHVTRFSLAGIRALRRRQPQQSHPEVDP